MQWINVASPVALSNARNKSGDLTAVIVPAIDRIINFR